MFKTYENCQNQELNSGDKTSNPIEIKGIVIIKIMLWTTFCQQIVQLQVNE